MIDHQNKFIHIHIPKNAGSSINRVIKQSNRQSKQINHTHITGRLIRECEPAAMKNYFKFAFVRNPWDRLYSLYKFNTKRSRSQLKFEEWIFVDQFTRASSYVTPKISIKKMQQVEWITDDDGNIMVDFVGRFETLSTDFDKIRNKLNITKVLPKINTTKHQSYKDVYDDVTNAFVEKYFADDIKTFGYKF